MSEKKTIMTEHGTFETESLGKYADRKKWEPKNPKFVYSFIPGTIVELMVKPGDKVKTGDSLMLFKAMKMDNNIVSEMDGTIGKVNVKVGDNVPKGVVMIEFK